MKITILNRMLKSTLQLSSIVVATAILPKTAGALTVNPTSASLNVGGSVAFTTSGGGSSYSWSMSPSTGWTITSGGSSAYSYATYKFTAASNYTLTVVSNGSPAVATITVETPTNQAATRLSS